ncbi:MAG TPA: ATP-binding protein [Paenibacillus sp.]
MLSGRQLTVLSKIEQAFDNDNTIVHLHGPAGGGKTTLVKEYVQFVISKFEDWSVYYIEGNKNPVEAYATITLAEGINRPKHELSGFNLNFGFKIAELFNLGIAGVFQKKPEFDPKVNFVIEELRKKTASNILIVADSFQYWDAASQSFLMTLKNYQKKLLGNKSVKILLVTDDDTKQLSEYIDLKTLYFEGMELTFSLPGKAELRELLYLLGYKDLKISEAELDIIMSITGGHLEIIKLFIEGYFYSKQGKLSTDSSLIDVLKMLEYRLDRFGENKKILSNVLQASSIISGDFKAEQIKYLLGESTDIDALLKESCEGTILRESNHFIFSNVFIQQLFYEKLKESGNNFKFKIEYAKYLKEQEPENYVGRAYYLSSGDHNNEFSFEIIELFTLAYCRNIESSTEDAESKRIEILIKEKVDSCMHIHGVRTQYNNFLHLKNAYGLYFQEKYDEANKELDQTSLTGPMLLMSEIKRMRLVIALMLNMNTKNVRRLAVELHDILLELKSHEKEQWCKIAFTLFSTYSNKLDDFHQSESIVNELLAFINMNYKNKLFEYMGKIISRKASVFKNAAVSRHYTADSVVFFEDRKDYLQYYLALCNHSGNLLVVGEYDNSISGLQKCLELVAEHPILQFPSQEKVFNNLILATFLKKYREIQVFDEESISYAIAGFEKEISDVSCESNAILYINLINLYVIKGDYDSSHDMLDNHLNKILKGNEDSFYRYHISNINLSMSILQQSWKEAAKYLNQIKDNFPNFHKKNEDLIQKRNYALSLLVNNKICMRPDQLDKWVYEHSNPLDDAGGFYCRLFLFSDLQFTSI